MSSILFGDIDNWTYLNFKNMIIDGQNDPISKQFLERINNPQNESDQEISTKYNQYLQWGYTSAQAIGALSGNYELKAPASKEYSPSIWGAIDNFIDRLTNNQNAQHSGAEIRSASKSYFASSLRGAKDPSNYWHPILGANERWKASIGNRTNPLLGVRDVVLPSVLGAAAVTYGPELVTKGAQKAIETAPKVVQTIAQHPKLSAQVAKSGALNLGSALVKGYLGAEAAAKDYWKTQYNSYKYNRASYFDSLNTLSNPLLPFTGVLAGISLLGHNKFKEPDYSQPEWNPNLDGIWLPEVEIVQNQNARVKRRRRKRKTK